MKKELKKRGFTLVELLAVIVILAVIALITTPMILGVIEKSKKAAFQNSVYGAIDALEYYELETESNNVLIGIPIVELELSNHTLITGYVKKVGSDFIAVNISDGVYCANGTKENLTISKKNCDTIFTLGKSEESDRKTIEVSFTPFSGQNIISYECLYGNSIDNVNEKGTVQNGKCVFPMGDDIYAKVCAIDSNGNNTCTGIKKIVTYLFKNGEPIVTWNELDVDSTTKENGYLQYQITKAIRAGIITNTPISKQDNPVLYTDMAINSIRTTGPVEASFSAVFYETMDISGKAFGEYRYYYKKASEAYEEKIERKLYRMDLGPIQQDKFYISIRKNVSHFAIDFNLYNIWLQY